VNQQFGKQAFDQAEKLFKDARVPENVQAIAQQGVAASKEFYAKTAAAAQDSAKVMTESPTPPGAAPRCSTRSSCRT
jgi:hypothetical protein